MSSHAHPLKHLQFTVEAPDVEHLHGRSGLARILVAAARGGAVAVLSVGAVSLGVRAGWWGLLAAIPVGLAAAAVAFRRTGARRDLARLQRLTDQAAELSRMATTRSSNRWSSAPVPMLDPEEVVGDTPPGRHRSDLEARITGTVNELLQALETEHSYRTLIETTGDLVLLIDEAGQIALASNSASDLLGVPPADLVGRTMAGLVHVSELEQMLDVLEDFDRRPAGDRRAARPQLRLRTADGDWRTLQWSMSRWPGDPRAVLLTGHDVTEELALAEQLRRQTEEDPLTRLPNRAAVISRVTEQLAVSTPERPIAVLMVDLVGFAAVNDGFGHAYGDALLALVGARLAECLRQPDLLGRVGGDEFAVVAPVDGPDGAQRFALRLTEQLAAAFDIDGVEITARASIGVALSHRAGRDERPDTATLMAEADIAMHRAKAGGVPAAVFDGDRDRVVLDRLGDSARLRAAITDGEIEVHYQPVIDIAAARVDSLEALVRWQHPERGLLLPADFLPLAESTGLIVHLSRTVLDIVLAQAGAWLAAGWTLPVAVNLSPIWLLHADVPTDVNDALHRHQVPADLLRMELTGGTAMADLDIGAARLEGLKELGVHLTLDDFGAGHSSIAHLRRLPVDQIKVDRTFVHGMALSEADSAIVRASVGLGRALGLTVVAEGVEDTDTLARVVGSGCTLAQGFYFTRPMPADAVPTWIRQRFPKTAAVGTTAAESA